jgi:hypothetical protein
VTGRVFTPRVHRVQVAVSMRGGLALAAAARRGSRVVLMVAVFLLLCARADPRGSAAPVEVLSWSGVCSSPAIPDSCTLCYVLGV